MSEEMFFDSESGNSIYAIVEGPDSAESTVVLIHGLHDHGGRYQVLSHKFNDEGLRTVRFDFCGYGRSSGVRGFIRKFSDYVNDYAAVRNMIRSRWDTKLFAYAHSMGALVLCHEYLDSREGYDGVVFSSGLFKVNEEISPLLQKMSGLVSMLAPRLKTIKLDFDGLSRDPAVQQRALVDDHHYKGGIRARTGSEILRATAEMQTQLHLIDFPMLLVHGENDPLTKPESTLLMEEKTSSKDKIMRIFPDARHELFNELDSNNFIEFCSNWINERA